MKNFRPVTAGNRSSITQNFRTRLALSTALATIAFGYAGRVAYAGSCVVGVPGTYLCSGFANPGTDLTQTLSPGAPLTVTTDSTFSIDTSTSGGNDKPSG